MSEENAALLRGLYEAFGRGDVGAVLEGLDENIHWSAPEVLPHGMHVDGREAVGGFFQNLAAIWHDFDLEIEDFVASGDRVCVVGKAAGVANDERMGYDFVHVWTVRDGRPVAFDEFVDPDPRVIEAGRTRE